MNTRPLTKEESAVVRKLNEAGFDSAMLFLTMTGLNKSILDATAPVRDFLYQSGLHDYSSQLQGNENKKIITAKLHNLDETAKVNCSLYRPKTKSGDPRIWPYNLNKYAEGGDILGLFCYENSLHLINLTRHGNYKSSLKTELSIYRLLSIQKRHFDKPSQELFYRLKQIADKGPIKAVGHGSTSIGRSIETALGIPMNSSQLPDFNGIELKSKRSKSNTRHNLFAKTPNWKMSRFKSARVMLNEFGYLRENNVLKLYCTVSSAAKNPQGLILDLDYESGLLHELYEKESKLSNVCLWKLDTLHDRLLNKHNETFWIEAKPIKKGNFQGFQLIEATHTRRPSINQFDRLLSSGDISIDHLLKLDNGKYSDKGHLFKIKPCAKQELFLGEERIYDFT